MFSKHVAATALTTLFPTVPAMAQTIYPLDQATILTGAKFDFKVEFPEQVSEADIRITVNGEDVATGLGGKPSYIAREEDKDQSAVILRNVSLTKPGNYTIEARAGDKTASVNWTVYSTSERKAKNVILFIGDGLSPAHRIGARLLSKGIKEGKSLGKLAIDDMPHMALVATAGSDSIITDSANSASAYTTGHKSAVNALGVYADRTRNPFDDPRVEPIASIAKRELGVGIGIVTNTEIQDATPASMVAQTRRRGAYDLIVEQMFAARPDVVMGGGKANFLPKDVEGSRRRDNEDYIEKFKGAGYPLALTASEMMQLAEKSDTTKLLGLFALGNMDGALDRKFLKGGGVKKFPEQPDLTDQLRAALTILSRNDKGFLLLVESGMIDKYAHQLDMERAVYDTIMLDNTVHIAKEWAAKRGDDTLIVVVADHNHPNSLVGTINDDMTSETSTPPRDRVGVYEKAGFPNYPKPNAEGYPERVDVSRRLAIFSATWPDHYETFRPKLDGPNVLTQADGEKSFKASDRYKSAPGASLRLGNISSYVNASVHSGEDVILTASGPGSERVRGSLDNTDVFRIMAEALGLGAAKK